MVALGPAERHVEPRCGAQGLGVTQWWLDNADAAIEARERAYRMHRDRQDAVGAARVAGALAWDATIFGGRRAVARAGLDRAHCALADEELGLPSFTKHKPSIERATSSASSKPTFVTIVIARAARSGPAAGSPLASATSAPRISSRA